jgi:hypothetical protein
MAEIMLNDLLLFINVQSLDLVMNICLLKAQNPVL